MQLLSLFCKDNNRLGRKVNWWVSTGCFLDALITILGEENIKKHHVTTTEIMTLWTMKHLTTKASSPLSVYSTLTTYSASIFHHWITSSLVAEAEKHKEGTPTGKKQQSSQHRQALITARKNTAQCLMNAQTQSPCLSCQICLIKLHKTGILRLRLNYILINKSAASLSV